MGVYLFEIIGLENRISLSFRVRYIDRELRMLPFWGLIGVLAGKFHWHYLKLIVLDKIIPWFPSQGSPDTLLRAQGMGGPIDQSRLNLFSIKHYYYLMDTVQAFDE